jgi:hypothetical protein
VPQSAKGEEATPLPKVMMKLKKSDSHRRDKKGQPQSYSSSSSSQSGNTKDQEAEWGLLSMENPVDDAGPAVPPQTSYHNSNNTNSLKKGSSWGGVFGFGRSNRGGEDPLGNNKSRTSTRTAGGAYMLSRTPKSTTTGSTKEQHDPVTSKSKQRSSSNKPKGTDKSTASSSSRTRQKQANSKPMTPPPVSILPTAPTDLFSDSDWMPQPVFLNGMVSEQAPMRTETLILKPAAISQHHHQENEYHSPSKPTSTNTIGLLEDASLPGFEITFENDADRSRLTATTAGSTTVMSLSVTSSLSQQHNNPQENNVQPPQKVLSPVSVSSGSHNKPKESRQSTSSTPSSTHNKKQPSHPSPSATSVASSRGNKKQQQHKQPSPSASSSASHKQQQQESNTKQQQSPVAHAAAKALVALSSFSHDNNVNDCEEEDDFGQHDFDFNEDESSFSSSSRDDEDESDSDTLETDMTGKSGGPFTITSQDSSSAFQFNLAEKNLKIASLKTKQGQELTPKQEEEEEDELDDDGFRIIKTKPSRSDTTSFRTQPTACSTMSTCTPNSNSVPISSPITSIKSSSRKQHLKIKASASSLSHHTNGSSTLFPPSSVASSTVTLTSKGIAAAASGDSEQQSKASNNKQQHAKQILSRPFGRNSLPTNVMPWVVQVAPAEWDNQERRWKYRVQVTRRQSQNNETPTSPSTHAAVTWRSLENFLWLEQALTAEFQGGLLLPLLSIAVGMTDVEQATHEVDAELLRNWLSDVLNGIRGQGELLLGYNKRIGMMQSEGVETFLYRSTAPLQKPGNLINNMMGEAFVMKQELQKRRREHQKLQQQKHQVGDYRYEEAALCKPTPRRAASPSTIHSRINRQNEADSMFKNFWSKGPLAVLTDELCVSLGCQGIDSPSSSGSSISSPGNHDKAGYERYTCSSQALGTADTLDIQDSFLDASTVASPVTPAYHAKRNQANAAGGWKLAQSSTLIQEERDLVLSYRKTALNALEKVQILLEEEENIGLAWKRFGVAVSSLFSYEKEVENAKLGEKKIHRDCMPYRKIKKSAVDQCMRALAQQKIDRSVPALRMLRSMLTAYVADLSAVGPSVDAYLEGIQQIAELDDYFSGDDGKLNYGDDEYKSQREGSVTTNSTSSHSKSDARANGKGLKGGASLFGSLQQQLRSFTTKTRDGEEKKNMEEDVVRTTSTAFPSNRDREEATSSDLLQNRRVEDRVLANERLLRESLTTLCKSTPMRTARMAYAYFKSEANQCRLLRSASAALRSKTDLSVKQAVSQMLERHQAENKADMMTELALAQRMLNLGNTKKYAPAEAGNTDEAGSRHSDDHEQAKGILRDHALQIARERVGRWNSDFAMAIMRAVGVDDPNVRVEQTTRELRLVRKYAIGLRENLNRCIEAVDILRKAVLKGGRQDLKGVDTRKKPAKHITDTRKEFFVEVAKLLSGIVVDENLVSPKISPLLQSVVTLSKAGILLNDPMGWSAPFDDLSSKAITSVRKSW